MINQFFKSNILGIRIIGFFLTLTVLLTNVGAAQAEDVASDPNEPFNPGDMIMHHILDSHVWHFWDGHYGTIYLPIIVYSDERGLEMFSSSNFYDEAHNIVAYNGYTLEHEHISLASGAKVYDFSIT